MKLNIRPILALATAIPTLLFGCSTAQTRVPAQAQAAPPAARQSVQPSAVLAHGRHPAADQALIENFVDALASHSGASTESIEDTLTQLVNNNTSRLSVSKIDSLDDIAALSDAQQTRIISALAGLPELSQKLALDSEAVDVARGEALAAQDVKGVTTETVPSLESVAGAPDTAPTFAGILQRSPAMKDTVSQILQQNVAIQQKTGVSILGKGCDSLQNESSIQNMASIMAGVERDVESGQAKDEQTVAQSLESNMKQVLGTDDDEAHARLCSLSDAGSCQVFSPKLCN